MAPILYHLELSPPVRAVLLTAKAIGLELQLKNIDLFKKEHLESDYVKMNPQHTVPTLNDDGFIIWDSHAINAYIVAKYAKDDSLYPKDLKKRAIVDQRLHFDSGILFPRLRNIFFPIFFLGKKGKIPEEGVNAIQEAYALTNAFLEGREYFAGDQLTIADFSAIATLSSVFPVVSYEESKYPNLTRWVKKMKTLPYYEECNGSGATKVSSSIKNLLEK